MYKSLVKLSILLIVLSNLVGCSNIQAMLEPSTYGVPNSKWYLMSDEEKRSIKEDYYQEQQLKLTQRQVEINEQLIRGQQKKNELLEAQNSLLKEQNDRARRGW